MAVKSGTGTQTSNIQAIDSYLESKLRQYRIPGLAVAIVKGDKIAHLKGFGIADPQKRAVTPDTPFILGSVSKSFTALAIMQLVDAGKVNLDIPVQKYLPWFNVADHQAASQITVRHLLNQTSGLSTYTGREQLNNNDISDKALEKTVRNLKTAQLKEPVGKIFQYSNSNYAILGLIVQKVAEMPYERYIQEHIFTPLEMGHSFTSQQLAQQATPSLSVGYRFWFGHPVATLIPYNRGGIADGFLISSAEDMAHYLIAHLNDGRYKDVTLLSSASVAKLHQPAVEVGENVSYGMGWFVRKVNDIPIVSHSGTVANYSSNITLIPNEKLGVVLLINVYPGIMGEPISQLYKGIASLLMDRPPPVTKNDFLTKLQVIALPILLVLQLLSLFRGSIMLRRWRQNSKLPPKGKKSLLLYVGLPLVVNGAIAIFLIIGLPIIFDAPLSEMLLFQPDLISIAVICTILALLEAFLRTLFYIRAVLKTSW
ncbi:penicillin-binding protein [Rivularia sp. IAM M-261]|nr:penicillin-binding protein [Rivularia sp. IAM M-261]